jgi:hypothetical protein
MAAYDPVGPGAVLLLGVMFVIGLPGEFLQEDGTDQAWCWPNDVDEFGAGDAELERSNRSLWGQNPHVGIAMLI